MGRRREDHICSNCGSDKTYVNKKTGFNCWDRREGKWYCRKCCCRLFTNPKYNPANRKRWIKIFAGKNIFFKKKSIRLKHNPRTGQCSSCKKRVGDEFINCYGKVAKIRYTAMHHTSYVSDDPLENAIELCASCHAKESWRLGQCWNYKQRKAKLKYARSKDCITFPL